MSWQNYQTVNVPPPHHSAARPRFSLTSDIIGFRHCRRQYGYFAHDGFVPAHAAQTFYGQIVHQVLDRCHRHYGGLVANIPPGTLPTEHDVAAYFDEVQTALRAHGTRPASRQMAAQALQVIQIFNRLEGPALYPRVLDTEYRLEADQQHFVLRGVVDVLAGSATGEREIWDYKGSEMPALGSDRMRDYEWQMSVYAHLYRVKSGAYPTHAVLYFLNELKTPTRTPEPSTRPLRAVHKVDFMRDGVQHDGTPTLVHQGLQEFGQTAHDIIACKATRIWPAPTGAEVPEERSCNICDIRWNCQSRQGHYPDRFPL
jgi:hypothetical protein